MSTTENLETRPLLSTVHLTHPFPTTLKGNYVHLRPLSTLDSSDVESLFHNIGGASHSSIYRFLPDQPLLTLPALQEAISKKSQSQDPLFFAIIAQNPVLALRPNNPIPQGSPVGWCSLMRITPEHRTLEIGHVLFSDYVHRSQLTTETIYLLMKVAFEWGFRRVEWKCDELNGPSKRAAGRLGFTFEGVFRQHMIVKGVSRDTAWFAVLEEEWVEGGVGEGLRRWLEPGNFGVDGEQIMGLGEVREEVRREKDEEGEEALMRDKDTMDA